MKKAELEVWIRVLASVYGLSVSFRLF